MDAVSLLQVSSALLLNLGFAWLVGSWFARYWMRSSGVDHDHFEPALRKLDLMAAAISMVGSASALLSATAVMGGVGLREACPMFWMMVSTTDYGHAGCAIIVAMFVLFFVRHGALLVRVCVVKCDRLRCLVHFNLVNRGHPDCCLHA